MVDNGREILLQIIRSLTEQVTVLTARVEERTQKLEQQSYARRKTD